MGDFFTEHITVASAQAMNGHFDGGLGKLQRRRDLLVRKLLEVPHQDHIAISIVEPVERIMQAALQLLLDRFRRRCPFRIDQLTGELHRRVICIT